MNICSVRFLVAGWLFLGLVLPIFGRSLENGQEQDSTPHEIEVDAVPASTPNDLDLTFDTMTTSSETENYTDKPKNRETEEPTRETSTTTRSPAEVQSVSPKTPSDTEQAASDSSETTTSVTISSSSVVVKAGRHFGSRISPTTRTATTPGFNNIQTVLKSRPSPPPISYNPTNYNKILKRRQNQTSTVITPELSNSSDNGASTSAAQFILSSDTTELPSTTPFPSSQSPKRQTKFEISRRPAQQFPANETLSSETEIPPTTTYYPSIRNPKVKIGTTRIPTLPTPKLTDSSAQAQHVPELHASSSLPWADVHRGPMPPPPTFDPDEDFTLYPDGIYKFKYSSSISFPPVFTSSRIYTEEFGVTGGAWEEHDDDGVEGSADGKDFLRHSTPEMSSLDENIPATPLTTPTTPPIIIDASEDDHFTHPVSPVYRDYFQQDAKSKQIEPEVKVKQITVTVTVTEKMSASSQSQPSAEPRPPHVENVQNENFVNFLVVPTPTLPESELFTKNFSNKESSNVKVKTPEVFSIASTSAERSVLSMSPSSDIRVDADTESDHQQDFEVTSPRGTFDLDPSPLMTSKEYKSVFYSTEEYPHFTSTHYTFTSSKEYSFTYPSDEDDDDHTQNHQDHQIHHHPDHQPDDAQPHHHPGLGNNNVKNFIQPTSTTTFLNWDVVGLKTDVPNQSGATFQTGPELPPNHTTPESTHLEENDIRKSPDPTLASESAVEVEAKKLGGTTHVPRDPPVTPTPADANDHPNDHHNHNDHHNDHNHESIVSTTGRENEVGSEISGNSESHFHFPAVPSYIQIFLDIPPAQFCFNLKAFKETIILVYKYNNRQITLDQVVVYHEPHCSNPIAAKLKSAKRRSSNSSPATNSASSAGNGKEIAEDWEIKENKTKRENSDFENATPAPTLYAVYVYILHKNGTYDQLLTESFIDLWNVTNDQGGLLLFNKIKKVEMIISTDLIGGETPANENTGVIAAISVASIAALCLLILGIILLVMRHRQAQNNFAKRCTPVTLDDYSLDNISVFNSFRRKQRNRASKRSYTNAGFDDPNAPTRPLDVDGLGTAVKEVGGIFEEFSKIPSVLPTLDDIPAGAESKNRYANVIPMPDTRVLLTFQDEQPNSDYINANFVQGASGSAKAYIITQGPLEETLVDFWRMIWEQQVRVIFMVTDFAEAGIPKCAEYYPRSETVECSQLHGDFQVTLEKREVTENCITSFLVLKDMARSLRRDVVHLWYHSWPEKGVAQNPQSTVDFLLKSRKYTREPNPILVHCSPGTGRSGTLVACDIGLKQLDADRKVDIPQIVKQLRHDRAGAVQTKDQYRHIYEVLQHYAAKYSGRQS